MRLFSLLEVLVANAVIVALLLWVTGDDAYRASYWSSEQFVSTLSRVPLFFSWSAARGSSAIPGLLTLDWQQVLLVGLFVVDALYIRGILHSRKSSILPTQ